jgi:hypothetical protein
MGLIAVKVLVVKEAFTRKMLLPSMDLKLHFLEREHLKFRNPQFKKLKTAKVFLFSMNKN